MSKLWEQAKAHPAIAGIIVFGVGLVFLLIISGGGKSSGGTSTVVVPQANNSDVSNGTALQIATLNAGVQTAAINAQSASDQAGYAAALEASRSRSATDLANVYAQADTTKYVADLGAKVALDASATQRAVNDANVSGAVQIASITALRDQYIASQDTLVRAGQINSDNQIANHALNNQLELTNNAISAQNYANMLTAQTQQGALTVSYALGAKAIDASNFQAGLDAGVKQSQISSDNYIHYLDTQTEQGRISLAYNTANLNRDYMTSAGNRGLPAYMITGLGFTTQGSQAA